MRILSSLLVLTISLSSFGQVQIGSDIDGEAAGDYSGGVSLSDDGTIMAIGAPRNDGNGTWSGHVRVYEYASGAWSQLGADIDGDTAYDFSGSSVSLSDDGTILAIGAAGNNGNGYNSGHVRVYEYASGAWSQLGADIDGEAAGDFSGSSVSLSDDGTILAIGAAGNTNANGYGAGHVRVYGYSSGSWLKLGADIDGEYASDISGSAVSLSADGTIVAIGASFNDGFAFEAGHVRVYGYSSGAWAQIGADIDGEAMGDRSGGSVSLSDDGTIVAIGAPVNTNGNGWQTGHVRVYELDSNSTWTQLGADIDGEATYDKFGTSVSLSDDGTILAIGANHNDGTPYKQWVGHVRVYGLSNGSWLQLGADIDGEATYDYSGSAVSLSDAGTVVAIGAPENDGNGTDAGHVRVYYSYTPTYSNGNLGLCPGDSLQLSMPNLAGRSYLWNTGDTTNSIDIYQGGNYSVIISTAGGWVDTLHTIANEHPAAITTVTSSGSLDFCSYSSVTLTAASGQSYLWSTGDTTQSITTTQAGSYYATITTTNGCVDTTATYTTTVFADPDTSVVASGALAICSGDSVTLTAAAGQSYLWSNGDTLQSITLDSAGSYYATVTTTNGCYDTTATYTTTVLPLPSPIIIAPQLEVCPGQTVTLSTQTSYTSYLWGGGVSGTQDSLVVGAGTFWLTVSDTSGCSGTDTITITELAPYTTQPEVCIVTNDSVSGLNKVIWERFSKQFTEYYNVYREGTIGYTNIGSRGVNQLSEFTDTMANPGLQPYKYYVTIVDSCGNEHGSSVTEHSTIHLQSNIGTSGEVNLLWTSYSGRTPLYYRIYRKAASDSVFTKIDSANLANNTYTDFNPPSGFTKYQIAAVMGSGCNSSNKTGVTTSLSNASSQNTVSLREDVMGVFAISPNPNNGYFRIEVDQRHIGSTYRIIDFLGRTIEVGTITKLSQDFDLSDKPKGVYRVQVSNEKASKTLNVVIQ